MTNVTEDELRVLLLAKLNHNNEFGSMDAFRKVMKKAQVGGESGDPIETDVSTDFKFNGDFESVVGDLVDRGLVNVSGGSYSISGEGMDVWRHNQEDVPMDEFKAIKMSKSLYNR